MYHIDEDAAENLDAVFFFLSIIEAKNCYYLRVI